MTRLLIFLAVYGASALMAGAHEVRPAYLELRETAPDTYDILWKVPARGGDERLAIYVRLPADARQLAEPRGISAGGAYLERWRVQRPGGLAGQTVSVDGLAATGTDVLVRLERARGSTQMARLLPSDPAFVVEAAPSRWHTAVMYVRLGFEHILKGVDHLLFVLGLLLIVRDLRTLLKTITAFTVAHSITLAVATLGYARAPGPPLEAVIALSILFLGPEMMRAQRGETSLTIRHPWVIAFAFGLLHGFGFASGLTTTGLPQAEIPLALLLFNLGVEAGQILLVIVMLALERSFRVLDVRVPRAVEALPAYAVGSLGAYWTIKRVIIMLAQAR
jgi:hydrogenase/urease accessory protein HupE